MSWDAKNLLIFLVTVGWKAKDVVKEGALALSCTIRSHDET